MGIRKPIHSAHSRRRLSTAVAAAILVGAAGAAGAQRVDNPYVDAQIYVNQEWAAHAAAEPGGSAIANQPTAVWMDRIAAIGGVNGGMGLRDHLDEAIRQAGGQPLVFQMVIYNLPGRDCAALASNGELGPDELPRYQQEYIDPIVDMLGDPAYASLRIVAVIEIDSLPNLVTNVTPRPTATAQCDVMRQNGNYVNGIGYALAELGSLPNVYNYLDAAHHGWIGWDDNFGATAEIMAQAATASGSTLASVTGFIVNTANYGVLTEPFFTIDDVIDGQPVRENARWIDFNRYVDELSFAQAFRQRLIQAGFPSSIGMLIDTSRNGWGGAARPTGPGPRTTPNEYVDGGRLDRRIHLGNWCNQAGAGLGERPRAAPAPGIDAYVWVKPPGESDGSSSAIPNDEGKGFDRMCDPTYTGNPRNNNNMSGALPNAPLSGHWFPAQFQELLRNAFPPIADLPPPPDPQAPTGTGFADPDGIALHRNGVLADEGAAGAGGCQAAPDVGSSTPVGALLAALFALAWAGWPRRARRRRRARRALVALGPLWLLALVGCAPAEDEERVSSEPSAADLSISGGECGPMSKFVGNITTSGNVRSDFVRFWNQITPENEGKWGTVEAQTYTWRNVQIVGGGFVPGIVFNQREPGLVYARTDIGGAYRLDTATGRWIPLLDFLGFDDWNLIGVDSLATDPVDPDRLYVLAGTYTNEWTSQNGAILRSTDRGATWGRTDLPFKSGGNMPGRSMGERLAIDPNRNSTLYLGARSGNGLWRSTDFGATWSRVTSFTAVGTFIQQPGDVYLGDPVGVVWVVFDPATGTAGNATRTIYVGVADKNQSLHRSTDAGATWAAVPGQPTGFLPHHGVLSSNGDLYVTYSDGCGPYDGQKGDVWKLATATGVWTQVSPVPSTSADDTFGYGGLAVDAQHPDTVMVAALNSWWPDTILFRSTDGGTTWSQIWDWASYPDRTLRYTQDISASPWLVFTDFNPVPPVPSPRLGWMVGDLEIDPFDSDRMLYGTGATIYGSEDLTAWDTGGSIDISVKAQGLEETAVLALISPPSGPPLISGLGDINGFRHDSLTVPPSRMFSDPSFAAQSLDYAELTPNFTVRSGNVDRAANPGVNRVGFSFDGGAHWFQAGSEPVGVSEGGTIAAAANASRVVWAPAGTVPQFSTTNGSSWTASTGVPAGATVASDRVDPIRFYAFAGGAFYSSNDGGASFTRSAATGLPGSARIRAVPGREGDVWLAGGTEGGTYGLWHSTDGGSTFTRLANVEEADNIGLGRPAPGQDYPALYTSAQVDGIRGIYRSDDAGLSWVRITDAQHQFGSTGGAITGDPRVYGRVYVGTNGRGIIYGEPLMHERCSSSMTSRR